MGKADIAMAETVEDWIVIKNVTIDDVDFEYDGLVSNGDEAPKYRFEMNRILHYTFKGQKYDVENSIDYYSSDSDYTVELRSNYKDDFTYKIDPKNPTSIYMVRGVLTPKAMGGIIIRVAKGAMVLGVLIDVILLLKCFMPYKKKRR
ncbi:MAG: hypothetical protein PHS74_11855 [Lachnospiraceae bacterium]|nr:hypothetical protein [Lachnospiraceae bacterium]